MRTEPVANELRPRIKDAASRQDAAETLSLARQFLALSNKTADVLFCASTLANLAPALQKTGARSLKTYIVRSVTFEPILPFLTVEAAFAGYTFETRIGGYGSYVDELLNSASALGQFRPDLVIVVLDLDDIAGGLADRCAAGDAAGVVAEIEENVARIEQLLRGFRSCNTARMVLQGLVVPDRSSLGDVGDANLPQSLPAAVLELNRKMADLCRGIADCAFFDVDRVAARHGRSRWRDERMFLASRLATAADLFRPYAQGLVRACSALFRAPRKVLCTDLDNTLWGGILGEDGVEGIATGSAYPGNCYLEYQRHLKRLSARGILLAIVSKNNRADVLEAFERRAADLALKFDDFAAVRIGWGEKSNAIREISEELSLGLDSFVFMDDNPVECEAVRQQLPEVAVLHAPVEEPWRLVEILTEQPYFDTLTVTKDDVGRRQEYRAQAQRAELESSATSRDAFLESLDIVCVFQSALEAPLARAVQLLAKTNQFNLTTRRRSAAEVEEFAAAPGGQAVVVRVRDRFGDAGVVGLALARTTGTVCSIDSFLLSCRVIGRGIETALLAHIAERARQSGATCLIGEFIPTKKNAPCANFYPDHEFAICVTSQSDPAGSVFYELDLTISAPSSPAWITLEGVVRHEHSSAPVPA
jgi:FkbH-like protein